MTEPEDFLTRWSRRKREAKAEPADQPARRESVPADVSKDAPVLPSQAGAETPGGFDLSKLPSLDSIGPETDIRVFMQPGIPAALSRAALRRAWAADPAIRDFIGLSENSWDFTAPDEIHGFGALDPADAKRLIANLLGGDETQDGERLTSGPEDRGSTGEGETTHQAETTHDDASEGATARGEALRAGSESPASDNLELGAAPAINPVGDIASQENAAAQHVAPVEDPVPSRRAHGRALPR